MTKVDIISGFLGAGKTTLIKKLLDQVFSGEKLVLIENEFGEVSVDGGFLQQAGIQVSELSSGCICCTLVGDFTQALGQVYDQYKPDRILIEPSGVAKLSDVIAAVEDAVKAVPELELNSFVTVVDSTKAKSYMKNIPEFYNNQIQSAGSILLSRTQKLTQEKLEAVVALLREQNPSAVILTTPWDQLDGKVILSAIEGTAMSDQLKELVEEAHEHQHEHDTTLTTMRTPRLSITITSTTPTITRMAQATTTTITTTARTAPAAAMTTITRATITITMPTSALPAGARKAPSPSPRRTLMPF